MSEYVSWLGTGNIYGSAGTRVQEGAPDTFRPIDISGCVFWLDGNDTSAVNANPFGEVESWFNKGDLSGNFDISGSAAVRYGDNTINGLNVVSFSGDAYMTSTFTLNFQDRSMFVVSRRNQPIDPSGNIHTWLTADTTDGQETGILEDVSGGTFQYILSKHPGFAVELDFETSTNTTGYAELATFVNSSTDVSGNYVSLNGIQQSTIVSNLASNYNTSNIPYYLGNFFGSNTLPNNFDMAELVLYNNALNLSSINRVERYLINKWAIADPPAPAPPVPPAPTFSPLDIAGCAVWLDGNQGVVLDVSGFVASWSNLGTVGTTFDKDVGNVSVAVDSNSLSTIAFASQTTLSNYSQLPYQTRSLFCVWENVSDLTTLSYPYENLMNTDTETGRQFGVSYDSNTSSFGMFLCQQGQNCPVACDISAVPIGGYNLGIALVDSTSVSTTWGFYNGGSNINTSSNLGNLFSTNPIPYYIGATASNSPDFRLAEFIEYDSFLSDGQIDTVANYLATKWAISSFSTLVFP